MLALDHYDFNTRQRGTGAAEPKTNATPSDAGLRCAQQQQEFVAELAGLGVQTVSKAAVLTAADAMRWSSPGKPRRTDA